MPKRKTKSAAAAAAGSDDIRSSKTSSKKQKRSKSKSKKDQSKSERSQNAIITSFARGLSHQIPSASLAHIANSDDSLRLLLEKSTESLPMGSAIRKAVGENFALCVDALTREVALRLAEEEERGTEQSDDKKDKSQVDQEEETEFVVFSATQYQKALDSMKSIEDSNEREKYRKKLASTPFASADVLIPLNDTDQDDDVASAKAVLGAFRSAALTGRLNESTMGGYITRMLAAVRSEITRSPVRSVSLIRNFLSCFAMSVCDKASVLMSDDGNTAFEYGELIGLMVRAALNSPEDYLSSSGVGGDLEESSSSDDESDIEDDMPGGSARKAHGKRSAQIVASAIQDMTCNLTLQLMSVNLATPHVIGGIVGVFSQEEGGSDILLQKVSSILSGVLINSSSAPKSAMPSKTMKSGKEKILMIRCWAEGAIENSGGERNEAVLSAEAPPEDEQRGGHDVDAYSSIDDEEDTSDNEESSSEDNGSDNKKEDADEEQAKADTGSAPDESLFVIDAAPDDEGDNNDNDKDDEEDDDDNDDDGGYDDEPVKEAKRRGTTGKASSRPPRPPASAKKPAALPTTTPRRSARSRSRGDSVSSLASANKVAAATPNTLPQRSTRSRSRGESMGSMGSLNEEGTPRRSARVRSRGDSMSQT